jgi:ribonuclease R
MQQAVREMHRFSRILRERRFQRGSLELQMPEVRLGYNRDGEITGANFTQSNASHQLIEEFMLAANEAVAGHFRQLDVPFLRRIHPSPLPQKLESFAEFARSLGFKIQNPTSRFELQKLLEESSKTEHRHSVHFAFLRSLKQAVYSPDQEGHFALASEDYCHFTSPIRRYPDLTVHRLLNQWIKKGRISYQADELKALGELCSKRERLAEEAERGAVELRLKEFVRKNFGLEFDAKITGVIERGFFAQGNTIPIEGFVSAEEFKGIHFDYDPAMHTLQGRQSRLSFRLGQPVRVKLMGIEEERDRIRLKWVKRVVEE